MFAALLALGAFWYWYTAYHPPVPRNCATWFDGCNTCAVVNGVAGGCTEMACGVKQPPKCVKYYIQDAR